MKKRSVKIISCLIVVFALGAVALGAGYVQAEKDAGGSFQLEYTKKDTSAPVGSKKNVFTILEVVPNESMAQIGYMIPGQEPVDMEELAVNNEISDYKTSVSNNGNELVRVEEKKSYRFTDELTREDKVVEYEKTDSIYPYRNPGNERLLSTEVKQEIEAAKADGRAEEYKKERFGVWRLDYNYNYSEYGYYENVGEGNGMFEAYKTTDSTPENPSYAFVPEGEGQGSYNWIGTGYYYKDGTEGEYDRTGLFPQITVTENNYPSAVTYNYYAYTPVDGGAYHYEAFHDAAEVPEGRPSQYGGVENRGDKYWTTRTDRFSYTYIYNQLTNHDLFIQQAFSGRSTAEGFQSQVLTVTPTQLNNMIHEEMKELIQCVDMIYIHGGQAAPGMQTIWDKYSGKTLSAEDKAVTQFSENDINWEVTMAIVERMASENPTAMVLEEPTMYRNAEDNNMRKLYLMLMQYGAKAFYNQFVLSGQITTVMSDKTDFMSGKPLSTGSYEKPYKNGSKTKWNQETFCLPGEADLGYSYMHEIYLPYGGSETYQSIFVYNGDETMVQCFLSGYVKNFTHASGATVSDAFEYFYEKDGTYPDGLNGLDFMEYILSGISHGQKEKTHLNILEIQPCSKFIYGSENWKLYYMSLIPWFKGTTADLEKDLTITTMSTWEFIGKIDDINSQYDFIIFGANQDASNGINGYNDSSMNGLIYSSIGDLVTAERNNNFNRWVTYGMGGKYVAGDDIIRYSGNDLNEKKYKALISYLEGEHAIVIDGKLYRNPNETVHQDKVDSSSVFYKLANLRNAGEPAGDNIFVTTGQRKNEMKRLVAYERCGLEFYTGDGGTGYPTEYTYEEGNHGTISSGSIRYVENDVFSYAFQITGQEKRNYGVGLYIDKNGDGIYSGSLVEQAVENSTPSEGMEMQITTQDGTTVDNGTLKAGTWYLARRKLPPNSAGILPWKLEVYDTDNQNVRTSVIKYSAVKTTSNTREDIKVLEMTLTPDMKNASGYYNEGVIYMATSGAHTNSQFKTYVDCVEDFNITVDYLENEDWKTKFTDNLQYKTEEEKIAAWKEYLDQYDMLILGYCDMCSFTSSEIYQEGFSYFVESGKSVMVSHDMVKDETYKTIWSKYVTSYDNWLRDLVGQRRYKTDTVQLKGKDIPLTGSEYHYGHRNVGSYTTTITSEDGSQQTVPSYGDNSISLFLKHGLQGYSDRGTNDKLVGNKNANASNYWWDENFETTYVNIVNQGQITNYPYKIDDVIQVNATHCQPSQLDMENNEMVVWYNLTDGYSKKYQEDIQQISGNKVKESYLGTGVYSSRENDVRNGFYIYSVGNITYTGMGHTRKTSSNKLTPDEMRLYVNTMISAYRTAAAKPYVEITNEDKVESNGDNLLYVPFDDRVLDTEKFLQVSLKVNDESIQEMSGRSYYLNFCDVEGNTLSQPPVVYDAAGNMVSMTNQGYAVSRDGTYYFNVPYSELEEQGKITYYLNLVSSYMNQKNIEVKTSDTISVTVLEVPLFNLN